VLLDGKISRFWATRIAVPVSVLRRLLAAQCFPGECYNKNISMWMPKPKLYQFILLAVLVFIAHTIVSVSFSYCIGEPLHSFLFVPIVGGQYSILSTEVVLALGLLTLIGGATIFFFWRDKRGKAMLATAIWFFLYLALIMGSQYELFSFAVVLALESLTLIGGPIFLLFWRDRREKTMFATALFFFFITFLSFLLGGFSGWMKCPDSSYSSELTQEGSSYFPLGMTSLIDIIFNKSKTPIAWTPDNLEITVFRGAVLASGARHHNTFGLRT